MFIKCFILAYCASSLCVTIAVVILKERKVKQMSAHARLCRKRRAWALGHLNRRGLTISKLREVWQDSCVYEKDGQGNETGPATCGAAPQLPCHSDFLEMIEDLYDEYLVLKLLPRGTKLEPKNTLEKGMIIFGEFLLKEPIEGPIKYIGTSLAYRKPW